MSSSRSGATPRAEWIEETLRRELERERVVDAVSSRQCDLPSRALGYRRRCRL